MRASVLLILSSLLLSGCVAQQNCLTVADILMIVDESTSVGAGNYELMKNFTIDIVNAFSVSIDAGWAQVGLMTYSTGPNDRFFFNSHTTATSIKSAISALVLGGGSTRTERAFFQAMSGHMITSKGYRSNATTVVMLLTDGKSDFPTQTLTRADAVKAPPYNASLFAIGVSGADVSELNNISSVPYTRYSHYVANFTQLQSIIDTIVNETCTSVPNSAVVTGTVSVSNITSALNNAIGGGGGSGTGSGTGTGASTSDGGLSSGQKVGLGIGIPLALVAVAAAVTVGICCAKGAIGGKRRKKEDEKDDDDMETSDIGQRAAAGQQGRVVTPPV